MSPFRFALRTRGGVDRASWTTLVRTAESIGYDTLCLSDHLDGQWGPLTAMASAATMTTRMRVASNVLCTDLYNPAVLAREIASLDALSEGRLEVGLGAGWKKVDFDTAGVAFDPPSVRITRLAETVHTLREHWADARPRPDGGAARPHPPICIGGGGREILTLAAREADIVAVTTPFRGGRLAPEVAASALPRHFDRRLRWIREAAAGRSFELQCDTLFVAVGGNRRALVEPVAAHHGVDGDTALGIPLVLVGTPEQICDALIERRERWGFTYWVVYEDHMRAFAPVIDRLAGT